MLILSLKDQILKMKHEGLNLQHMIHKLKEKRQMKVKREGWTGG